MEFNSPLGFALDILTPKSPFFSIPPLHPFLLESWPSDPFQTEIQLQTLRNRVASLELGFDRAIRARRNEALDRRFKWTAEIKGGKEGGDRKYKVVAEMKAGGERKVKWTADVKGKGSWGFEVETMPAGGLGRGIEKGGKKGEKKKAVGLSARGVEIEEGVDAGGAAIRKVCV